LAVSPPCTGAASGRTVGCALPGGMVDIGIGSVPVGRWGIGSGSCCCGVAGRGSVVFSVAAGCDAAGCVVLIVATKPEVLARGAAAGRCAVFCWEPCEDHGHLGALYVYMHGALSA
jgi:hypothetical protein